MAKTNLIEAEFQNKIFENNYLVEYYPQKLTEMIQDALFIFKNVGQEHLIARCLRNFAVLKCRHQDYFEAKRHIDEALGILKRLDDQE